MKIIQKSSTRVKGMGTSKMKYYEDKGKLVLDIDGDIVHSLPVNAQSRGIIEEEIHHYRNFLEDMNM